MMGYMSVRMLTIALGFLSNVLIVNQLSATTYGSFSLLTSIINISVIPSVGWVSASMIYFGVREREKTGSMRGTMAAWVSLAGSGTILTALVLFAASGVLNAQMQMQLTHWAVVLVVMIMVADLIFQCLIAMTRQLMVAWVELGARILSLTGVILSRGNIYGVLWAMVVLEAVKMLAVFAINREQIFPLRLDRPLFKEIMHFSLWQLFGLGFVLASQQLSGFIINSALTLVDVSTYSVAYRLVEPMANMSHIFIVFYAPSIAKHYLNGDKDRLHRIYYRERLLSVVALTVLHTLLILLAPVLFGILYPGKYVESVRIFQFLVPISLLKYIDVLITPYANTSGKFRQLQFINALGGAATLVLSFILVHSMGIEGVVLANVAGAVITSVTLNIYFGRKIRQTVKVTG